MDATRSEKYSRHIVVTFKKFQFRNNKEVGWFSMKLREKMEKDEFDEHPVIKSPTNKLGSKSEFLDNIYTKNRNLRILGSSKF